MRLAVVVDPKETAVHHRHHQQLPSGFHPIPEGRADLGHHVDVARDFDPQHAMRVEVREPQAPVVPAAAPR